MPGVAVEQAFGLGARRVGLHTCTLDNPAALPNYLKRCFVSFKTEAVGVWPRSHCEADVAWPQCPEAGLKSCPTYDLSRPLRGAGPFTRGAGL
jgi:hypothetical protein